MQAWSWNILFLRKCAYATIFAAFFVFAAFSTANAATPAKAPAKGDKPRAGGEVFKRERAEPARCRARFI